jgi:hypothetical protein
VDFHVVGPDGRPDPDLTLRFDEDFETTFYRHSASAAHRVMMLDCRRLDEFATRLGRAGARLVLEITGAAHLPDVHYVLSAYDVHDPARPRRPGEPTLLCANTTTLVDVILNRRQTDKLLQVRDSVLNTIGVEAARTGPPRTGRAAVLPAPPQQDTR